MDYRPSSLVRVCALALLIVATGIGAVGQTCPVGPGGEEEIPVQGTWLRALNLKKCAEYQEFTNVDPCIVRWYLRQTRHTVTTNYTSVTNSQSSSSMDANGCTIDYSGGLYTSISTVGYNAQQVTTYDTNCIKLSDSFSGTQSTSFNSHDYGTNTENCGSMNCFIEQQWSDVTVQDGTTGALSNGGWTNVVTVVNGSTEISYSDHCGGTTNLGVNNTTNTPVTNALPPSVDSVSPTGPIIYTQTTATTPGTLDVLGSASAGTAVVTYDDEYTDCMLIELGVSQLGATPYAWDKSVCGVFLESDQRKTLDELDWAQFWYQYNVPVGTNCTIRKYYTAYSFGCANNYNTDPYNFMVPETVVGDGQKHTETNSMVPVCRGEFVGYLIDDYGVVGGQAEFTLVVLDKVTIQILANVPASCASCGGGGNGGSPGTGQFDLTAQTAESDFNLGAGRFAQTAGFLQLIATNPSPAFSTPSALSLLAPTNLVTVITNSTTGALRQLGASQCLVDIVTNNAYQYQLVFYPTNALTPGSDGVTLLPTNGLSPLVIWTMANPDGATATNRL